MLALRFRFSVVFAVDGAKDALVAELLRTPGLVKNSSSGFVKISFPESGVRSSQTSVASEYFGDSSGRIAGVALIFPVALDSTAESTWVDEERSALGLDFPMESFVGSMQRWPVSDGCAMLAMGEAGLAMLDPISPRSTDRGGRSSKLSSPKSLELILWGLRGCFSSVIEGVLLLPGLVRN